MSARQVFTAMLLCMALLIGPGQAMGASNLSGSWTVNKIGSFKVPQEWQAVELSEVVELMQNDMEMMKVGQAALAITPEKTNPLTTLKATHMSIYHLTMHDSQAYHTASLVFFKDQQSIGDSELRFFGTPITPEERERVETMIKKVSDMAVQKIGEVQSNRIGFTKLEMAPLEFIEIGGKQGYSEGVRIIATIYGITCPLYAHGYVFDAKGSLATAVLVTSDAERTFWDPIIRKVVKSYH